MPRIARPDGAELHWEATGSGPSVMVAMPWNGHPRPLAPMFAELERRHRLIVYHPRGTGESTRAGPYDLDTDAGDLAAVVEASGDPSVAVVALLDAVPRSVRAAVELPQAIKAVVAVNSMLRTRGSAGAMGDSPSVLQAMLQMIETSYRAGVRTVVSTGNPDFDEAELHQRVEETVEFVEPEAATERLRAWVRNPGLLEDARALGDRLWWLTIPTNPWFPADLGDRVQELLPEAHVERLEDGPFTRPDLTAAVVGRVTGAG